MRFIQKQVLIISKDCLCYQKKKVNHVAIDEPHMNLLSTFSHLGAIQIQMTAISSNIGAKRVHDASHTNANGIITM